MLLFDTHCHYNLSPLNLDWQKYHQDALAVGITKSLVVGTTLETSQQAVALATQAPELFASLGIHPHDAHGSVDLAEISKQLRALKAADTANRIIAIGEVGLDYFRLTTLPLAEQELVKHQQRALFIEMIALAKETNLPLILHVRDQGDEAYLEALDLLEKHWNFQQAVLFHCVSGPNAYIERALALPHSYFGFDGNISFKNAEHLRTIFTQVHTTHPEKILLETDAPYLAPEPHRGQLCQPAMLALTANYVSSALGASLEQIYSNSLQAFNLSASYQ